MVPINVTRIATPHNKALANLVKKRAATEKLPSPPAKRSTDEVSKSNSNAKESESPETLAKNCGDVGEIEDVIEQPVLSKCFLFGFQSCRIILMIEVNQLFSNILK